jgi:undecaprenyl pyrophosphate phosphatase UppP
MVLGVAFEMGFIIALPIVLLAAAGKWLDARHHTHVWLYVGIVLALASSVTWLFQRFEAMVDTLKRASKNINPTHPQEKK